MAEQRIPFFRPSIEEEDVQAVADTLRSGWLTTGPNAAALEQELADYCRAAYVNAVNSCTAAMHLALEAWGIGPGDEVITTVYTFASTAHVIDHVGATPVLVDVLPGTANIDPAKVEAAITPRTKAIIPVHFAGEPCDMDAIGDIARRHRLKVLEDAAHAIGTEYRGRRIGTHSDAAAFSFYATKNMTTGEGGALATDDEALSDRVRMLTLHGMTKDAWRRYDAGGSWRYDIQAFGWKYNLPDTAAALGRRQLARLEQLIEERTRVAQRYLANLREEPLLELPAFDEANRHAWHLFVVRVKPEAPVKREDVIRALAERGIGTSVHFIPLHYHTAYRELGRWQEGDFPVAEAYFAGAISLPMFPDLSDAEVDLVCDELRAALRG
ncbi:MAG: DegT/DnrJ/EryC1/StrS family aminotransferase [Dehalococcoidia bacterium]|nr:DegT/DnrJ/EryC1/StrS family aminotransferase [Dehalococcoidia bacterium]